MKKTGGVLFLLFVFIYIFTFTSKAFAVSSSDCYLFNTDFGIGSRGEKVVRLQTFLIEKKLLDIHGAAKGYYGPLTKAGVMRYQRSIGLAYNARGFVGPITRKSLNSQCVKSTTASSQSYTNYSSSGGGTSVTTNTNTNIINNTNTVNNLNNSINTNTSSQNSINQVVTIQPSLSPSPKPISSPSPTPTPTISPVPSPVISTPSPSPVVQSPTPPPQAPVVPAIVQKVLVVYNTSNSDSVNLKNEYISKRPGFTGVNTLGVSVPTAEVIDPTTFSSSLLIPITNWLSSNSNKSIQYIVLMYGLPSRISGADLTSVQVRINSATNAYVTSLDMGSVAATQNYINKISVGTDPIISGTILGKIGASYYLDDAGRVYPTVTPGKDIQSAILSANPSASITYADTTHISRADSVEGYFTWGKNGGMPETYPSDGSVSFSGKSSWYIIETVESYNGQSSTFQGNFVRWFQENAFGGSNYSNTPIAAVTHVEEPQYTGINNTSYFKQWEEGKTFAEAAWGSRMTPYFKAIGDPLVKK